MAPKKKTTSMVVKSQQSTEKNPLYSACLSPSPSADKEEPDWSLLPPELLELISENLGDSFDASIHARSVCHPWRSTFSYPSRLLSRTAYFLPSFATFPNESKGYCTLQNFPVFLFISGASTSSHCKFFLGGIVREESEDHLSPVQCSVKVKFPWSDPTLINMRDYKIVPLGRQDGMISYDTDLWATSYRRVAFLPLTKNGGGEFVALLGYSSALLILISSEMRWKRLELGNTASCCELVTFRGRFYVLFHIRDFFVIDPYSLEATQIMLPAELHNCGTSHFLVPSGNDELLLVEQFIPRYTGRIHFGRFACRVSRLDEETGEWVVVSDLEDRILLIGPPGNRTCSVKELPDGCGISGNSILFTAEPGGITYPYKYGVHTRCEDDLLDLNFWRSSRENRMTILSASPNPMLMKSPVVAFQVER